MNFWCFYFSTNTFKNPFIPPLTSELISTSCISVLIFGVFMSISIFGNFPLIFKSSISAFEPFKVVLSIFKSKFGSLASISTLGKLSFCSLISKSGVFIFEVLILISGVSILTSAK
jgi:hypothetical protein